MVNLYPSPHVFERAINEIISGNLKLINTVKLYEKVDLQVSCIYLAPDIIPQGKIYSRFTLDLGLKMGVFNDKGEIFFNVTDLLNTFYTQKDINGNLFNYNSIDYNETQVLRIGFSYKF